MTNGLYKRADKEGENKGFWSAGWGEKLNTPREMLNYYVSNPASSPEDEESRQRALKSISVPEMAADAVGGLAGTGIGYLLSKSIHRKPKAWVKALYMLAGAAAGATGTHFAMKNIRPIVGFNGSLTDWLRLEPWLSRRIDEADMEKAGERKALFGRKPEDNEDRRVVYTGVDTDLAKRRGGTVGGTAAATAAAARTLATGKTILPNRSMMTQRSLDQFAATNSSNPGLIKEVAAHLHDGNHVISPTNQPLVIDPTTGRTVRAGTNGTTAQRVRDLIPSYNMTQMGREFATPAGAGRIRRAYYALRRFMAGNTQPATPGSPRSIWTNGKGESYYDPKSRSWKVRYAPGMKNRIAHSVPNAAVGFGTGYAVGTATDMLAQWLRGQYLTDSYNPWLVIPKEDKKKKQ